MDVSQLLSSDRTISRGVQKRADDMRKKLFPILKRAAERGFAVCTMDFWKEIANGYHILTTVFHFIDDAWVLWVFVGFTVLFPFKSATAAAVSDEMIVQFALMEISKETYLEILFVSDNGSNVKKALANHERLYCTDHGMNRALQVAGSLKVTDINLYNASASEMLTAVQHLVLHLKKLPEAEQFQIKEATPPLVARRPMSYLAMLSSVEQKFDEVYFFIVHFL